MEQSLEFKVEHNISPVQLQTKLNQWRHTKTVDVLHYAVLDERTVSAVVKLSTLVVEDDEKYIRPLPIDTSTPPWN